MSIDGVVLKELTTHADERGFFREVIRESDEFFDHFGQWSHSLMHPGVAKAWHIVLAPATRHPDGQFVATPGKAAISWGARWA